MKTFERNGRINFVDEANVFVGFDYESQCCEQFSADVLRLVEGKAESLEGDDFPGFLFDPENRISEEAMAAIAANADKDMDEWEKDNAGFIAFRLTNGDKELFVVLQNAHNGYYCHGFVFGHADGETIRSGSI